MAISHGPWVHAYILLIFIALPLWIPAFAGMTGSAGMMAGENRNDDGCVK